MRVEPALFTDNFQMRENNYVHIPFVAQCKVKVTAAASPCCNNAVQTKFRLGLLESLAKPRP